MKINKLILLIAPITLVGCKQEKEVVAVQSFAPANAVKTELSTIDLSLMNKTIRPEDDFFLFSNGNWIKNNPIPPSESRWGSFNELENSNKKKLTEILENLNLEEVMDIIHCGFLMSKGYQLVHIPLARQISFICNISYFKSLKPLQRQNGEKYK